jgi:hypothetical protein
MGQRVLWGAAAVLALGGVLTQAGVFLGLWTSIMYAEMSPEKAQALASATPFIARGFFVAALLSAALSGVLFAGRGRYLKPSGVTALLVVLVALDGGRVSDRFLSVKDFDEFAVRGPVVDFLVEREATEEPFRVLDLGGPQAFGGDVRMGMWGLDLAGGHHPNDLRRYRELVGMRGGGRPENIFNSPAVNRLLNVRYIVWPAAQVGGGLEQVDLPGLRPIEAVTGSRLQDGRTFEVVYAYPGLDRARLVERFDWVDEDEAVARILAPGFDPAGTVLITRTPEAEAAAAALGLVAGQGAAPAQPAVVPDGPEAAPDTAAAADAASAAADAPQAGGAVEWLDEGTDRIRLRVDAPAPTWLVVSENHYPTWAATVGGEDAPVLRAYHTLQAVPIPAGEHEVVLEVRAAGPVRTGLMLSAGSWLLLAGLAGASRLRRRQRVDDS